MYSQCKYVVLEQEFDGNIRENIYVFPSNVVHKSVAVRMKGKAVSAGFVAKDRDGRLYCRGNSESLRVGSREEDNILLRSLFT